MEALFSKILSEGWLIYLLFFMIVAGFIWKGIPYLLKKFDETTLLFAKALIAQQTLFKEELEKISRDFLKQVTESNAWHTTFNIRQEEYGRRQEDHWKKIEEIIALISKSK